jgi:hypothetical protein
MGLFSKYLSGLNFPLSSRGLLKGLVAGGGDAMDGARESILWLLDQFLPQTCDDGHLRFFADSRGVRRLPNESFDRYRSRVVHAWRRGTVGSVEDTIAAAGYQCEVIEAGAIVAAWTDAGGGFLDGVGTLDGGSDLSAPGMHFNWVPVHWAEYMLDLDISAGMFTKEEQRVIMDVSQLVAPARSRLLGLRFFMDFSWYLRIRTISMAIAVACVYDKCNSAHVPEFDIIGHGCEPIGGTDVADFLDGAGHIDGWGFLTGLRPDGGLLDDGHFGVWQADLQVQAMTLSLGNDRQDPDRLDPDIRDVLDFLDGSGDLGGEILNGGSFLDGGTDLSVEIMVRQTYDMLDGYGTLGMQPGCNSTWHDGYVDFWHGNQHYREAM